MPQDYKAKRSAKDLFREALSYADPVKAAGHVKSYAKKNMPGIGSRPAATRSSLPGNTVQAIARGVVDVPDKTKWPQRHPERKERRESVSGKLENMWTRGKK